MSAKACRRGGLLVLFALSACATPEAVTTPEPRAAAAPPVAASPAPSQAERALEEARALLAQAESDVHRAASHRALWSKAWESLLAARAGLESGDAEGAARHARRASQLAQLGMEQLAYPPVN